MRKTVLFMAVLAFAASNLSWAAEDASSQVSSVMVQTLERDILKYVENHRADIGLASLPASPVLDQFAMTQTQEMVKTGLVAHTWQDGTSFDQRFARAGLCGGDCPKSAEIISVVPYSKLEEVIEATRSDDQVDSIAHDIVQRWLDTDTNRANIEDPSFEEIGVSAAVSSDGKIFSTLEFLRRTVDAPVPTDDPGQPQG